MTGKNTHRAKVPRKRNKSSVARIGFSSEFPSTRTYGVHRVHSERISRTAYVKVYDRIYNQESKDISETVKYMKTLLIEE